MQRTNVLNPLAPGGILQRFQSANFNHNLGIYIINVTQGWMQEDFVEGKTALIDLRTAQVYWDAMFLVSQEAYLNFHHFCG